MNKILLGFIAGVALGSVGTWLWVHRGTVEKNAPSAETTGVGSSEEKINPLRLSAAQRDQAGITLVKAETQLLTPEVQAFGRVLDPSSLATAVADLATARAALDASEKELERVKKLFTAGGNASGQAVETAQAAAARDAAALNSAQARLTAAWGRQISQNAVAISETLAKGGALIRIDSLPGDSPAPDPKQARVALAGQVANTLAAEIIGPAPNADAQVQGASFLALVRDASLPIGSALRATLPGAGEAAPRLVVPRSAIVYHLGSAWIYALGAAETFERKLVDVGPGIEADKVAILAGAPADEQIVATGAQQLLAAELETGGTGER